MNKIQGRTVQSMNLLQNEGTCIVVIQCRLSFLKEPNCQDVFLIPYQKNNKFIHRYAKILKQILHLMKYESNKIVIIIF